MPPEPDVRSEPTNAFGKCRACHSVVAGTNGIGPSLAGVYGRPAGSVAGFRYSAGLAASQIRWDEAALEAWLSQPQAVVPDTKMLFAGLRRAEEREEVIAFLKTL
jgi:cytochrome c